MATAEVASGNNWTCFDVLDTFDAAIRPELAEGHNYYVLGGIPTAALVSAPNTIYSHAKTVLAEAETTLPLLRENGTRRDIDVLVDTILSKQDKKRIKSAIVESIDDSLAVSVFGFDEHVPVTSFWDKVKATKDFLSSRTVDEAGVLRYELGPIAQPVPTDSYQPWELLLPNGSAVQILHPAAQVLAYRMRSISGLRQKDVPKYEAMRARVEPMFREEIEDGIFKSWAQFAKTIEELRDERAITHPNLRPKTVPLEKDIFRTKARSLRWAESHKSLVNLFQREGAMELVSNLFVHAK